MFLFLLGRVGEVLKILLFILFFLKNSENYCATLVGGGKFLFFRETFYNEVIS